MTKKVSEFQYYRVPI